VAARNDRLEQLGAESPCDRLQAGDALVGQQRIQRAAVRRVLGRIEMQRRTTSGERDFRHDVLLRRDVRARIAGRGADVVVGHERPKSAPGIGVGDRALAPQARVLLPRAVEGLGLERIEILWQSLAHG
jgi:hypothetical protein